MDSIQEQVLQHKPLTPGRNIRILALQPSPDFNSDIQCVLFEGSLDKAQSKYEALSYVWGSKKGGYKIVCNSQPLYVTKNCQLALRYLRKKRKRRYLWVDAICIDQLSNDERRHQVELMGEVYKYASNVIIWLGEARPDTKRAFRDVHIYYCFRGVVKQPAGKKLSPEFLRLMKHAWFQRVWTFQELLVASRATVHCGRYSLPWDAFVAHVESNHLSGTLELYLQNEKFRQNVTNTDQARRFWKLQADLVACQTYSILSDEGKANDDNTSSPTLIGWNNWLMSISLFSESTGQRLSSEPLDRLYGLYGLLRMMGFALPKPDYYKTGPQVAQELTYSSLVASRSLAPLYCFPKQCFSSSGSSWAVDWESFKNASELRWGTENELHRTFRPGYKPVVDKGKLGLEGVFKGALHVFGSPVPKAYDYLPCRGHPPWDVTIMNWLQDILDLTKPFPTCPNGQAAWEALFIVYFKSYHQITPFVSSEFGRMASILLNSGMVSPQSPRHISLMKHRPRLTLRQLHTLSDYELHAYIQHDTTMQDFAEEIKEMAVRCSGGILFRTSEGFIGISMSPVESKDILALFHGSSVPAILRPVGAYYQLVSFVSVQGIPNQAWPINGNEEGVQSIVLV